MDMTNNTNNTNNEQENNTAKSENILVDIEKIERLVNKVADLVITNSMMAQSIENLSNANEKKSMQEKSELFERHIKELQDYAMEIRMVNMETIYKPFLALVEEVSQKNSKKVKFGTFGESTNIDKSMIEPLLKPLNELLTNAIVHGIESPKQRLSKGKEEVGLVKINSEQINGQIVITIFDDGKGIDLEKVSQDAIKKEYVTQDDLNSMSDNEKALLILNDKSMLNIKKNIDSINGSITIETKSDVGTTITIYIPMTLSILEGLNIRVGSQYFILPTVAIVESLQPTKDIIKAVGDGSSQLLMLRDDFIPIIKLNEYLNVQSDYDNLIEGMLIVIKAGKDKVAIFLDEFLNQQQVVVKPIDKNFREVVGVNGATVRGDGSIGLILDVKGIVDDTKNI